MDYVLFGIQGSGKGTQGKIIAEKFGYNFFETGAELRRLSNEDSELGKKVNSIISAGHLVSNEVVMEIVENFIKQANKETPIIWDGLPRKIEQADSFDQLLAKNERDFTCILIDVPEKDAIERLLLRKRSDDNPESIKNRVQAFYDSTQPVIEKYQQENKLIKINGAQEIEEVTKEIFNKVNFQ